MFSHKEIERLGHMEHLETPMVSCYLSFTSSNQWKKELEINLKDCIKEGKEKLGKFRLSEDDHGFLSTDLNRVKHYFDDYQRNGERGVIVFSHAKKDFFLAKPIYHPIHNRVVIDFDIYLKPLMNLFQQNRRYCVVCVSQKKAHVFEFFMGHLERQEEIFDVIPKKVKSGGFHGYEGKKIERHNHEEVRHHFKTVANKAFELFMQDHYEDLILVGEQHTVKEFETNLHSYLKERVVGRLHLNPETELSAIKGMAQIMESDIKRKKDYQIIDQLMTSNHEKGLGVIGLSGVLRALERGSVQRLIVSEDYSQPGWMCFDCSVLRADGSQCPMCGKELTLIRDIVNQAVEEAIHQRAQVHHLAPDIPIPEHIGALLRFAV